MPGSESIRWKDCGATRLTNGVVELIALTGGGHLAEFRFLEQDGRSSQNVLWEAPWVIYGPAKGPAEDLSPIYGPVEVRKFLAGYTGHALCLDYFGEPSAEQAAAGLSLHGEAASVEWNVIQPAGLKKAHCRWNVELPSARLTFEREILLGDGESVAYVREAVSNESSAEHACDWVQHVAFGSPLLKEGESTLAASAQRGISSPLDYDGGSLLAKDREFVWPYASRESGNEFVDLRKPFSEKGCGFIAGVQLDPQREVEYVLAMNWKLRLGVGYCFRRHDFPWMTIWEENCGRQSTPWNGKAQARGMEFGTAPLPRSREETVRRGSIFNTPQQCVIPAGGKRTARYLIFLFAIPAGINSIQNVDTPGDAIVLYDQRGRPSLSIPASGCKDFLA